MAQSAMKASERLPAARAAKEATIRKISEAEGRRKDALLKGDDPTAATADHEIAELRLAVRRREDEIELLPSLIALEQQEARLPRDLVKARALLADKERRHRALQRKPKFDLSAADQMELDGFPIAQGQLRQHIEMLERFAS
jgi:hypothetical protein